MKFIQIGEDFDAFCRRPLCCPTFTLGCVLRMVLNIWSIFLCVSQRELIFVEEKTVC